MPREDRACFFAAAILLVVTAGCSSLPNTTQVRTNTGNYPGARAGTGAPTVVFEAGAGDGMETWAKVFPEVARFTTAFAYSRLGYGAGLPVLSHRDGAIIVEELRGVLAAQGLRPPYILVGHSLGGLYMQLFARQHPGEVAGAVLVDTTHPDQMSRMKEERPGNNALLQTMMSMNALKTVGAELRALAETGQQWHAAGPFPRCPMILLSASHAAVVDGTGYRDFMDRLQAEVVSAWPDAERRTVDSGHYIQRENPDAVITAIRDVMKRAAKPAPLPNSNSSNSSSRHDR